MSDGERTRLRRHKVGFVFQRFNLLPTLDAFGNIAIAQHIHGDGFDPHRFQVVCEMLGLRERLKHRPGELSGGEQQRVAIARAIVNEPKILLADEPTGNLDTKNSENVLNMLRRLNRELGQTIVMITHNPEAAAYSDRVVHMRDGISWTARPPTESMRTIWRILTRTVFWSFERGTWPYDVAVAVIVVFVLLSPRSWFHDQPPLGPPPDTAMVQLRDADVSDGTRTYRVSAKLLVSSAKVPESELEHQLHEAVRQNVETLQKSRLEILRIEPIRADDGSIVYYDVSIKP